MFPDLRQRLYKQDTKLEGGAYFLPIFTPQSIAVDASTSQETCVLNCTDKFLKHSERVGARFAEHNAGTRTTALGLIWKTDFIL